jgi:hypothetical protein
VTVNSAPRPAGTEAPPPESKGESRPLLRASDDYLARSGREGRKAAREVLENIRERVVKWRDAHNST